ncbi:MAG: NAD(P)/FAD-dependent oxidoreductase [Phycisphaerales bacterium]|nr:NAD(P)/FAD-dependent oxidoreductase [Phycisphaerales bacterium]
MSQPLDIGIAGAGLAGSLLASLLAQDGHRVTVFERREDPRRSGFIGGRSINLALSTRGLEALTAIGLQEKIMKDVVPMRGRIMHDPDGRTSFHPYSVAPSDAINSVSRGELNIELLKAADEHENVTLHFEKPIVDVDFASGFIKVESTEGNEPESIKFDLIVGADGAYSTMRNAMQCYPQRAGFGFSQTFISHSYKELVIPPLSDGSHALDPNALHIWPRGASMMIALPNADGSFTCTLFWPREGQGTSFESLAAADDVTAYIGQIYPDAVNLMPTLEEDARNNPVSPLVMISCDHWYCGEHSVLLGDAAHAIVPFFGQGMNSAFQDCMVLREHLRTHDNNVRRAIVTFSEQQKPNGDAISKLSLDNFLIMRDRVSSRWFRLSQHVEKWLHRLMPSRVQPVYNLVSFTTTPYQEIVKRQARRRQSIKSLLAVLISLAALVIAFFIGTFT